MRTESDRTAVAQLQEIAYSKASQIEICKEDKEMRMRCRWPSIHDYVKANDYLPYGPRCPSSNSGRSIIDDACFSNPSADSLNAARDEDCVAIVKLKSGHDRAGASQRSS
ncbi:unnamed protein product [Cercospora beticola]|nr:unnamed protein product [Cercospora beticola]